MVISDRRGVTTQVGAVLLLGIFVLMLTTYQANVVPQENRATEFDHSREVLDEMQTLQADYHNTMSSGEDIESVVTLGTEYPSRLLAVNPPPASGSLTTTPVGSISSDEIDINAVCGQDGTTRALKYEPNYRAYQSAPTITFESSVLYSDFGDEYIVESKQSIISDDQLTLMPLNGSVSKRGTGRQSVRFRAGKADTAEVDGELNLTIPTEIPADQWENDSLLLANEMVSEGGHVEAVVENATADGVDIRLEAGTTYDVACRASGTNSVPSSGPAEGSIGGGSEVTTNPGAGKSGESEFGGAGSTETFSSAGGLWTGISGVNSVQLTNPRFAPTDAENGQGDVAKRYFRLGLVIANETTEYTFLIGDKKGIEYKQLANDRDWNAQNVDLYEYEEGTSPQKIFDNKKLTVGALNNWLDGGSLGLADKLSYQKPSDVESGLTDVRAVLNNSEESEIYITNMHGRTEATLEDERTTGDAYFLSIDDDSSTEIRAVKADGDDDFNAIKFGLVNELPTMPIEEISNISINVTNGPTVQRIENDRTVDDEYEQEVYFDGDTTGEINSGFDTGSSTEFDSKGSIDDDSTVVVYVNGFRDGDDNPVELDDGDEIETTYEYVVDGETYEQTLTFEIQGRQDNN